jgi:hypothetical protein
MGQHLQAASFILKRNSRIEIHKLMELRLRYFLCTDTLYEAKRSAHFTTHRENIIPLYVTYWWNFPNNVLSRICRIQSLSHTHTHTHTHIHVYIYIYIYIYIYKLCNNSLYIHPRKLKDIDFFSESTKWMLHWTNLIQN